MAEETTGSNVLDEFEKLKAQIRKDIKEKVDPTPKDTPKDNPPQEQNGGTEGNPDGNSGGNGGSENPPEGNNPPAEEYDNSYSSDGESHAYDLGKMGKDPVSPQAKHHSGAAKAPERKKSSYKPGASKDFLQVCYNEIIVASYAGIIDLGVDLTLDIMDWILFAPFSGGSTEKKPEKNKTIFNYADDIIAENNAKGKELAKSFLEHHKEIMDNVERAKNGQTPEWVVWKGQQPECFTHLVEISRQAETDPNSPEATQWNEFKDLPRNALTAIANQINMLNFAVHNAALTTEMTDVEPLPADVIKGFKNMEKAVENPKLNDNELKSTLTREINEVRRHITTTSPVNTEITEQLNNFSQLLLDPSCTREAIAVKIIDLEQIHPIKQKLKETAAATVIDMRKNMERIKIENAGNPERAKEELAKYFKKIKDTQEAAMAKKQKDMDAMWAKRKVGGTEKKAEQAIRRANNTIKNVNVQDPQRDVSLKKQIENNKDIQNIINQVGLRR